MDIFPSFEEKLALFLVAQLAVNPGDICGEGEEKQEYKNKPLPHLAAHANRWPRLFKPRELK